MVCMAQIHLIGTVHLDVYGKQRLESALAVEKPDVITLEANPQALAHILSLEGRC